MVTMVLLNVALMWAMPLLTFRLALRFLLFATDVAPRNGPRAPRCRTSVDAAPPAYSHRTILPHFLHALLACHSLARPFTGPRIGFRPLPTHRQAAPMTEAPVAADVTQPGDV